MKRGLLIIEIIVVLTSCGPTKIIYSENRYRLADKAKKELIYKALYFDNGLKAKVLDYKQGTVSRETEFDCLGNVIREINYYDQKQKFGFEKNNKYEGKNLIESSVITFEDGIKADPSIVKFENSFDNNEQLIKIKTISENDTSVVTQTFDSNGLLKNQITIVKGDTVATQLFEYNQNRKNISRTLKYFETDVTRVDKFIYVDSLLVSSIQINNGDTIRVQKHCYKDGREELTEVIEKTKGKKFEYKIKFEYEYLPAANKRFIQCRGSE